MNHDENICKICDGALTPKGYRPICNCKLRQVMKDRENNIRPTMADCGFDIGCGNSMVFIALGIMVIILFVIIL